MNNDAIEPQIICKIAHTRITKLYSNMIDYYLWLINQTILTLLYEIMKQQTMRTFININNWMKKYICLLNSTTPSSWMCSNWMRFRILFKIVVMPKIKIHLILNLICTCFTFRKMLSIHNSFGSKNNEKFISYFIVF